MTREKIEDIRFIVIPFVVNILKGINYEGQGDSDAKEFIDDFNVIFDLAIKALEQEPRWIPASERLPKPNAKDGLTARYYLIQNEYEDMLVARYDGMGWNQMYQHGYLEDDVIAWMPLPKPYKAESEQ